MILADDKSVEAEIIYDENGNAGFMVGDTLYLLSEFMRVDFKDSSVAVLCLTNFHALVIEVNPSGDSLKYWYEEQETM